MTREEFQLLLTTIIIPEVRRISNAGQTEYTLKDDALDNFNRLSDQLGIDREIILWVYLQKHLDGIVTHLRGNISQREPVVGRITDAIVYLCLLWAMTMESKGGMNYE